MPSNNISKVFKLISEGATNELKSHLSEYPDSLNEIGKGARSVLDRTPLFYAIQDLKFEAAHLILDFEPDLNYLMPVAPNGSFSALTFALNSSPWDQSVFDRIVVDDSISIDEFGVLGQNALILAVKYWSNWTQPEDILRKLIANGANPNARSVDGGQLKDRSNALEIAQIYDDFPENLLAVLTGKT